MKLQGFAIQQYGDVSSASEAKSKNIKMDIRQDLILLNVFLTFTSVKITSIL